MENHLLVWKRHRLTAVLYLGIVSACLFWSLSVGMGLEEGFAVGTQNLGTGQAIVKAQDVSLDQYFTLKAMVQNLQGVVAVSERMSFQAEILDNLGNHRQVAVKGIDFTNEGKVTGLGSRLKYLKAGYPSSLFAPESWENSGLVNAAHSVTFIVNDPNGNPQKVKISGYYQPVKRNEDSAALLMDMDQARILYGDDIRVNEMAIRLNPRLNPQAWVTAHQDDFKSLRVSLVPWTESPSVLESRLNLRTESTRFYALIALFAGISAFSMLVYGWNSRSPRSSLAMALLGGPKKWSVMGAAYLAVGSFTLLLAYLAQPVYQGWLMAGLLEDYPYVGTYSMYWSWNWPVFIVPLGVLGLTVLLSLGKPQFRRRQN